MARLIERALTSKLSWVRTFHGDRLHYVAVTNADIDDMIDEGFGFHTTACGLTTNVWVPGFISRLGCQRCTRCVRATGLVDGWGTPSNDKHLLAALKPKGGWANHQAGWWRMACWNGLSTEQQERLVMWGNLPIDYEPEGWCPNGAQVAIETEDDTAPGPRFLCRSCGIAYLSSSP